MLAGKGFRRFLAGGGDEFPVGVLPAALQKEMGASTQAVLLSRPSADKQCSHHPDVTPDSYRGVQRMLDQGRRERQSANRFRVYGEIGGKPHRAALKVAASEVHLLSLHRI